MEEAEGVEVDMIMETAEEAVDLIEMAVVMKVVEAHSEAGEVLEEEGVEEEEEDPVMMMVSYHYLYE